MDDKFTAVEMKGGTPEQNYAAVIAVIQPALRTVLDKVAATHNNEVGPWLDELEQELIRNAKNTIAEGIAIQTDAAIMKFGIDVLQTTLGAFRRGLVIKE